MEGEEHIHRKRSLIAAAITIVVLVLLAIFVWRVLYFSELIRSGDISGSGLSFTEEFSTSVVLASQPVADGTFAVTTTDDPSLGNLEAPVIIVEFADFGCPYSRESSFVVRELATQYPDKVRFVYRDFPLTELHPIAQKAAEAGECAQDQGMFWEYHDKLYQNQSTLTESRLVEFAVELNMNSYQFELCLNSGRYANEVLGDYEDGLEAGVRGTPTFFINGNRIAGAIPQDILDALIQSILSRKEE
jgi:protein-disulfide isomerase